MGAVGSEQCLKTEFPKLPKDGLIPETWFFKSFL